VAFKGIRVLLKLKKKKGKGNYNSGSVELSVIGSIKLASFDETWRLLSKNTFINHTLFTLLSFYYLSTKNELKFVSKKA
jgi:hypothetical protein